MSNHVHVHGVSSGGSSGSESRSMFLRRVEPDLSKLRLISWRLVYLGASGVGLEPSRVALAFAGSCQVIQRQRGQ